MKDLSILVLYRSLFGMVSPSFINVTTNYAPPAKISVWHWFLCFWKGMTSYAVGFSGINTRHTIGTKYIKTLFNKFHMFWVTAECIIADNMIEYIKPIINWKGSNKHGVEQTMSFLISATKTNDTVSSVFSSCPIPTLSIRIYDYFRKNTPFLVFSKSYSLHI